MKQMYLFNETSKKINFYILNALNEIFILFEVLKNAAPSISSIPSVINIFLYYILGLVKSNFVFYG